MKRKSTRRKSTRRRSTNKVRTVKSPLNSFFTKTFCISLMDSFRWPKVSRQFKRFGVKCERFVAVDGRCKDLSRQDCLDKLKTFELAYDVTIDYRNQDIKSILPPASLTIGTILLLRAQVRNGWKRMLIFEDDVEFVKDMNELFKKGVRSMKDINWDVLYLGCGNKCGIRDIREGKDSYHKHSSMGNKHYGTDVYVRDKRDLRDLCEDNKCKYHSETITRAYSPKGTWAYAYSLKGAKKALKYIDDDANEHIDQLLANMSQSGLIKAYAFDPIIVHHEYGTGGQSFIPWDW